MQLFANEIAIAAPRGTNGIARPLVVPGSRKKRLRWIVCIRRGGGEYGRLRSIDDREINLKQIFICYFFYKKLCIRTARFRAPSPTAIPASDPPS